MSDVFKIRSDRLVEVASTILFYTDGVGITEQEVYIACRMIAIFYEQTNKANWHNDDDFTKLVQDFVKIMNSQN